jgi:hypothetical protein
MSSDQLWWLRICSDTRFGQEWIQTREGIGLADFLYASIQSDAIYLALGGLEIQLPDAYESVEFPLERIFHIGVPR